MGDRHLRSVLLKLLHYRLSDNDRERLHFFLKNDVPRRIGDDKTLSGTLNLMQSLFDEDKINGRDFTLLIDAFTQIQCFDAAKLLQEHERRMLLSGMNQSTQSLASIMPSILDQFLDYEEDLQPTDGFPLTQINYTSNNNHNHMSDSNNININSLNTDTRTARQSRLNQLFHIPSLAKICFLLFFIFLSFILGTLAVVVTMKTKQINSLNNQLQIKENIILETENRSNQTTKQLSNLLSENNKTIDELKKQLSEREKEKSTVLIKAGRKFGGPGGEYFDDSRSANFTCSHYLSGLIIPANTDNIDSCQFLYISSHDNQSRIESTVHGYDARNIVSTQKFHINIDEKIYKVQVKVSRVTFSIGSNSTYSTDIIGGLRFYTKNGRSIPPISYSTGEAYTEEFDGYTLGYVTGKSGLRIDQLQFFWYRTI